MLRKSPFFLAPPASWCNAVVDVMADESALSIPPAKFQLHLQQYFNICSSDSELFDFGSVYGVIDRQKGIKGTALVGLLPLIDRLLAISPCSKVRKPELKSAIVAILAANKHRTILPSHPRPDVVRYIVAQASPRLVFVHDHCQIVRLSVHKKHTHTQPNHFKPKLRQIARLHNCQINIARLFFLDCQIAGLPSCI